MMETVVPNLFYDPAVGVYAEVPNQARNGDDRIVLLPTATTDTARDNRTVTLAKARQAVADNITSIGQIPAAIGRVQGVIDGTATNLNQANAALDELAVVLRGLLNDYERMLRQLVAVERLLIGSDLLDDTTGT